MVGIEFLDPFPNGFMAHPPCSIIALLKLKHRKYKYNAYSIISSDVLSRSIILIEVDERMFAIIAFSRVNTFLFIMVSFL